MRGTTEDLIWAPPVAIPMMTQDEIIFYAFVASKKAHEAERNGDLHLAQNFRQLKYRIICVGMLNYPGCFLVTADGEMLSFTQKKGVGKSLFLPAMNAFVVQRYMRRHGNKPIKLHIPQEEFQLHLNEPDYGYDEKKELRRRILVPFNASHRRQARGRSGIYFNIGPALRLRKAS